MIHTDGTPTIANCAGDRFKAPGIPCDCAACKPEPRSPHEAELLQAINESLNFGAWRAFANFRDGLRDRPDLGREDILKALDELTSTFEAQYNEALSGR